MTPSSVKLLIFAAVCCLSLSAPARSINEVNVLLPYSRETKVLYELTTSGGCYRWRSSLPQVISVTSEGEECSERATLRVETAAPDDRVVWIMAADRATGAEVRVEARVEQIVRIEILTKLRTIEAGDLATLELIGFDLQGNAFSTLEGLRFAWQASSQGGLAEVITFAEAGVRVSAARGALEAAGRQSDHAILRGRQVGPLRVSAALAEPLAGRVSHEVPLLVVEHFLLWPEEDLLVSPCDAIQLRLSVFRRERGASALVPVALPDSRIEFRTDAKDKELSVTPAGLLRSAAGAGGDFSLKMVVDGRAETTLEKKVRVAAAASLEVAALEVASLAQFDALRKSLEGPSPQELAAPKKNAQLLFDVGKKYALRAFALDAEGRVLRLGAGRSALWTLPEKQFAVVKREGDLVLVEALGLASERALSVRLEPDACGGAELSASRLFSIVSAVKIIAPTDAEGALHLPLLAGERQVLRLAALGGSGDFEWSSSNSTAASVSFNGLVRANSEGWATIVLSDSKNKNNRASVKVTVSALEATFAYDPRKELGPEGPTRLLLGAHGPSGALYANCSSAGLTGPQGGPFSARAENLGYQEFLEQARLLAQARPDRLASRLPAGLAPERFGEYVARGEVSADKLEAALAQFRTFGLCQAVALSAAAPGLGELSLSLENAAPLALPARAFERALLELPREFDRAVFGASATIAPGSSVTFTLSGGPSAWFEGARVARSVRFADPAQQASVQASFAALPGGREALTVKCLRAEASPVDLTVEGVIGGLSYANSTYVSSNPARVLCREVAQLGLFLGPDLQPSNFTFLLAPRPARVALRNEKEHELRAWAFDAAGGPFWNFSQPMMLWESSRPELGKIGADSLEVGSQLFNAQGKGRLSLNARTGDLKVTVSTPAGLRESLEVSSVNQLALEPSAAVLRFDPAQKLALKIVNGSGRFRVSSSDPGVAQVEFAQGGRTVEVFPRRKGRVTIRVEDLELSSENAASATLELVEPDRIDVEVQPHSFEDETRTLKLRVFGNGHLLEPAQLGPAEFRLSSIPLGLNYTQTGPDSIVVRSAGPGEFAASVRIPDTPASSESLSLRFYEKLRVFPENVAIFAGCSAVFKVVGGPSAEMRAGMNLSLHLKNAPSHIKIENISEDTFKLWGSSDFSGPITLELRNATSVFRTVSTNVLIGAVDGLAFRHPQSLSSGQSAPLDVIPTIKGLELSPSWCPFSINATDNDPSVASAQSLRPSGMLVAGTQAPFNLTARSAGKASFTFEFFPLLGAELDQLDHRSSQQLKTGAAVRGSATVTVYPSLLASIGSPLLPPCAQTAIVLPPDARAPLPEEVSYAQLVPSDHAVTLSQPSTLISHQKQGLDILLLRRKNEDPSNLLAVPVYVSAPTMLFIPELSRATLLAPDSTFSAQVHFLDRFGRQFFSPLPSLDLAAFSSNPAVLEAFYQPQRGSLSLHARRPGKVLVVLRAKHFPAIHLSLALFVGPPLLPAVDLLLSVGAAVSFKPSPLTGLDQLGDWKSSAPEVLRVEGDGSALARAPGLSKITLMNSFAPSANAEVIVLDGLRALPSNPRIITSVADSNYFQEHYEFRFELVHRGRAVKLSQSHLIKQNLQFACTPVSADLRVRVKETSLAEPLSCEVWLRKGQTSASPRESFSVSLTSETSDFEVSQKVEVDVVASFFVNGGINSIYTNLDRPESFIQIKTQEQLDISAGELTPFVKTFFHPNNRTQSIFFTIPKGYNKEIQSSVTLTNRASHQTLTLPFVYEPDAGFFSRFSLSFASGSQVGIADLLVIGICLTIIYYIFGEYRRYK